MNPGRGSLLVQAALFVVAIAVLVRLTGASKDDFKLARGDRLLVADFVSTTEDAVLGAGLDQVLKIALDQSRHILLYPDSGVRLALRQMRRDPNAALTPDSAAQICEQQSIPAFVVPKISRLGDSYLMGVQLFEIRHGGLKEVSIDTVRANGKTDLICAVDELSQKIRRTLGESDQSLGITGEILPSSATGQAEALTLFVRALALEARENYEGALGMLQQTVVLNPRFALAQMKLGELLMRLGAAEAALDHVARAEEEADALPLKERLRVRGIHALLRAEYSAAGEQYRTLEAAYPEDPDTQLQLADLALQARDFGRAVQHFEKAVRLDDSRVESYLGLCMAHLYERNTEAARKALSGAQALDPENPRVIYTNGFVDLVDNNLGSALRSFSQVSENPSLHTRSLGLFLTSQAQIYGGRFRSALATLQEGIDLDRNRRDQASEASKRLSRAQIYLLLGDEPNALEECRQTPLIKNRAEDLRRIGLVYTQTGRTAEARGMLDEIEKLPNTALNRYHAAILAGEIEMASGRPQAAISILSQAKDILPGRRPSEPLARALFQAQRYDEAESEYRAVCEQKAEMLFPKAETWFMGTWSNALFETGRCLATLGKNDEAIQYFRNYLWVLDGSDPGFPKVQQAKENLKKGAHRFATR
jgi:tetratricopeptide (TPR) repeat protein